MQTIVQINPDAVEDHRDSWPCHNLDGFDYLIVTFDGDDLSDLTVWEIHDRDDHRQIPSEPFDGEALAALVEEARAFGASETERVRRELRQTDIGVIVHVMGDDDSFA